MTPMERIEGELSDAQKRIAELEYLLARQAKAAQQGMDAAKAAAYAMEQNASRMYAESNPQALESERAANAVLTEQIAELEQERDDWQRLSEQYKREAYALAAHVERLKIALDNILNEVGTHSHDDLSDDERQALSALEAAPTISLARHDALKQVEAMRHVAKWLSGEIEESCIGLDLGGEIAGPTRCSDADKCRVAGERIFREAARIWECRYVTEVQQ